MFNLIVVWSQKVDDTMEHKAGEKRSLKKMNLISKQRKSHTVWGINRQWLRRIKWVKMKQFGNEKCYNMKLKIRINIGEIK